MEPGWDQLELLADGAAFQLHGLVHGWKLSGLRYTGATSPGVCRPVVSQPHHTRRRDLGRELPAGGSKLQLVPRAGLLPVQDHPLSRLDVHDDATLRQLSKGQSSSNSAMSTYVLPANSRSVIKVAPPSNRLRPSEK
jgi:hypothetical protein